MPRRLRALITKVGAASLQLGVEAFSLFTAAQGLSPALGCSCLNNVTEHWGWLNYTFVSLKAAIPSASGHDCVSGPIRLGPQLCMAAGPVTDLLNTGVDVITVLSEVNLLWV